MISGSNSTKDCEVDRFEDLFLIWETITVISPEQEETDINYSNQNVCDRELNASHSQDKKSSFSTTTTDLLNLNTHSDTFDHSFVYCPTSSTPFIYSGLPIDTNKIIRPFTENTKYSENVGIDIYDLNLKDLKLPYDKIVLNDLSSHSVKTRNDNEDLNIRCPYETALRNHTDDILCSNQCLYSQAFDTGFETARIIGLNAHSLPTGAIKKLP